jgi:hypothetical protein
MMAVEPLPTVGDPAHDRGRPLNRSLRDTTASFSVSTVEEATALEDIFARQSYGRLIVWGYLLLLAAVIFVPLIAWSIVGAGKSANFLTGLTAVKDFTTSMFAGLAGLSGLAGLVIGRHFPVTREQSRARRGKKKKPSAD